MTWPDDAFPPCGPCAFCGSDDKRHRLWDAIAARHAFGETVEALAADYGYPAEAIARVVREWDEQAQAWRKL